MYNIKQAPIALKTLTETQGFKDVNGSLQKLWDDVVETHSINTDHENEDPIIWELYEYDYKSLDTYPRGALLDILATTVTSHNGWPSNGDSEEVGEKFVDEYINNMINKYEFRKL